MELIIGLFLGLLIGSLLGWLLFILLRGNRLVDENFRLANRLQATLFELRDLRTRLRLAGRQIVRQERQQGTLQEEINTLQGQVAEREQETTELKARSTSIAEQLDEEQGRLTQARMTIRDLQEQVTTARITAEKSQTLQEENQQLHLKLRAADSQVGHLQGRLESTLSQLEEEQQQLSLALARQQALYVRFTEVTAELERAEAHQERYLRSAQQAAQQLNLLKLRHERLQTHLAELGEVDQERLAELEAQNERLRNKLQETQEILWDFQLEAENQAASPAQPERDRLQGIDGIGPAYARKLYKAGINTFADLAETTPEQIYELTGAQKWQIDAKEWIAEARELVDWPDV